MNDYQAIYDAVNLNFSGASYLWQHAQQEIYVVSAEMQRPSVLYRPSLQPDGHQWCALYGKNLQEGVAGYGDTPAAAMTDFDKTWREQKLLAAKDPNYCRICTPKGIGYCRCDIAANE